MGGKGQEQLLATPVRVQGLDVTAAYLAAGGTPVETDASGAGFFAGKSVADFNPDAAIPMTPSAPPPFIPSGVEGRPAQPRPSTSLGMTEGTAPIRLGLIARVPFGFPAELTRAVAVGGDGVVYRVGGCADCFAQSAAGLSVAVPSVAAQALGALTWQRIALGLADALGALRLSGEPGLLQRCEAHR